MKCSLCGYVFNAESAARACAGCRMAKTCDLARCPNCGFEAPVEPKWIKALKKRMKGDGPDASKRSSGRDS